MRVSWTSRALVLVSSCACVHGPPNIEHLRLSRAVYILAELGAHTRLWFSVVRKIATLVYVLKQMISSKSAQPAIVRVWECGKTVARLCARDSRIKIRDKIGAQMAPNLHSNDLDSVWMWMRARRECPENNTKFISFEFHSTLPRQVQMSNVVEQYVASNIF